MAIKSVFIVVCLYLSSIFSIAGAATVNNPDDKEFKRISTIAKQIGDWAEVGYKENKSSALLQDTLANEGFKIETGLVGIPTSFVASYGEGKPIIAILAEFDALPGISQNPVPFKRVSKTKNSSHACGHNLFGAASVSAGIRVKEWMERTGKKGTIRVYGTPAEEGGSGKVYMARDGLFKDVDFVMHWHADDVNTAAARGTLANRSAKFRFRGVSAHAAGHPDKALSALDGVEAMNMMVNLYREHMPPDSRIHYVITNGGVAPNVVPNFSESFYYVRHPDAKILLKMWDRVTDMAKAAALGTGTRVDWEVIHGNHPLLINEVLAKQADKRFREAGGINFTAEDLDFAKKVHATIENPTDQLGSEKTIKPYGVYQGFGSTDVGDVSWVVPTVGIRVAAYVAGTSGHSWQAAASSGSTVGYRGANKAAEVLTMIAQDLFTDPKLRQSARQEFDQRRGKDFIYKPLLGDRLPPLNYRD